MASSETPAPTVNIDASFLFDWGNAPGTGPYFSANNVDAATQITSAALMGSICLLVFSGLRMRWPELYSHRLRLRRMRPPTLPRTLLGWVYPMVTMSDRHVLETIGLDALLFLRAYRMLIYLFATLSVLGMAILYPVNFFWGEENGDNSTHTVFDSPLARVDSLTNPQYAVAHAVLACVFAMVLFFYIDRFALHTVAMRWHFLLLTRRAGNARTLMVTHLPRELRSEHALRAFISAMQLGRVEAVAVAPPPAAPLDAALAARAKALRHLEAAYAAVLGNPCRARTYDPVLLRRLALTDGNQEISSHSARALERQLLRRWAASRAGTAQQRPQLLRASPQRWWPLERVDAIDHWREALAAADRQLRDARDAAASVEGGATAFVTMQRPVDAYVISQVSVYARPSTCKIRMAPEARSVVWANVGAPYAHKTLRGIRGVLMTAALLLLWCVPVVLISTLISLRFLITRAPGLADVVRDNRFVRSLLSYTVPSLILTIFMTILPRLLWSFVLSGGDRAYGIADKNMWIRHFYFLVIYIVVIFGMSGSVWSAVYDMFTDFGGFWSQLVAVLPQMATWYCVYVMLYGAGYQVMKLLHLKSVCRFLFLQAKARTPRDYMKAISPVFIDWGTFQPYTVLFFFIGILYAHLQPLLLPMCMLYYLVGLFVMKYMVVYAWYFRQENAGTLWPVIIRRMVVCVLLYQALLTAIFSSNDNHWFVAPMVVLMLFTWYYFWVRCPYLKSLSETVPLQLMREAERRRALVLAREKEELRANKECPNGKPAGCAVNFADVDCDAGRQELVAERTRHVPRSGSWLARMLKSGVLHPIQALVRSASFLLSQMQGDPGAVLWSHIDDYAFPERVSPLRHPAGRSALDPSRAKEQPGSLVDIVKSSVVRLPRGLKSVLGEFLLDFSIPRAHLDSSVTEYPVAENSGDAFESMRVSRRREQQQQGSSETNVEEPSVSPPLVLDSTSPALQDFCLAPGGGDDGLPSSDLVRLHRSMTNIPSVDPVTRRPTAMQYQRHSSELPQGTQMNGKHTDFAQPNQSYVDGVLDSTPFSYVHPGLYGDLPSLWLPVPHRKRRSELRRSARQRLHDAKMTLTQALENNITGAIPHRPSSDAGRKPPAADIASVQEDSDHSKPRDAEEAERLAEDLHVVAECGRLGIDPAVLSRWDPTGLHRCTTNVDVRLLGPAQDTVSEPSDARSSLSGSYGDAVLSDSESDNDDGLETAASPRGIERAAEEGHGGF